MPHSSYLAGHGGPSRHSTVSRTSTTTQRTRTPLVTTAPHYALQDASLTSRCRHMRLLRWRSAAIAASRQEPGPQLLTDARQFHRVVRSIVRRLRVRGGAEAWIRVRQRPRIDVAAHVSGRRRRARVRGGAGQRADKVRVDGVSQLRGGGARGARRGRWAGRVRGGAPHWVQREARRQWQRPRAGAGAGR